MEFFKFEILSSKEHQSLHQEKVELVVNRNHIVSLKPIKFIVNESVINGYWLRLSNGKKYKAFSIPSEIAKAFNLDSVNHLPQINDGSKVIENYQ